MSRPTDAERGARIALEICDEQIRQPDLFPGALDAPFWLEIHHAAVAELHDADLLRLAVAA